MDKLKIGIIGCGGIANQKHLPSLKANADKCEIVAFCDIIEERAVKACQEYGIFYVVPIGQVRCLLVFFDHMEISVQSSWLIDTDTKAK